jgi:hypothetical protein
MKARAQKIVSAAVGSVGLALLAMMVAVENEPGLIPVVLVVLAAIGYGTALLRERTNRP